MSTIIELIKEVEKSKKLLNANQIYKLAQNMGIVTTYQKIVTLCQKKIIPCQFRPRRKSEEARAMREKVLNFTPDSSRYLIPQLKEAGISSTNWNFYRKSYKPNNLVPNSNFEIKKSLLEKAKELKKQKVKPHIIFELMGARSSTEQQKVRQALRTH